MATPSCKDWNLRFIWAFAFCTSATTIYGMVEPVTCPGLTPGLLSLECTGPCQEATCRALALFFNSTYNTQTPNSWRNNEGWEDATTQDCSQIVATPAQDGTPSYCSWHGVTCCSRSLQFLRVCNVTNALLKIKMEVNGLTGSVSSPDFEHSIAVLHACGLISLELAGNALSGTLSNAWGEYKNLSMINFAKNMIHGTIPDAMRQLNKLMMLQLDRNLMHGTIPEWLSELRALQILGLSAFSGHNENGTQGLTGTIPCSLGNLRSLFYLALDSNSLTGPLPAAICHSNLIVLILRSNQLTGSVADLLNCTGLGYLDMHSNKLSGTLPNIYKWNFQSMTWLDLSKNEITGTIPMAVYRLDVVGSLNLANNRLNGSIHSAIAQMPYLVQIDLHGNQLTGTIDESVWYMNRLNLIDLSRNNLRGTLSSAIGFSHYLSTVLLDNNQLTGRIPAKFAILPSLATVDLQNNSFSCTGANPNKSVLDSCSSDGQLLPCFLKLSDFRVPRSDASNMECPVIERRTQDQAMRHCFGYGPTQLGSEVSNLPADDMRTQNWHFDPSYYQFHGCKCLGGFRAVWDNHQTVLTCQKVIVSMPPWLVSLAVVLVITGTLLLAAAGLMVWLKLTVQLRRKWQRERELMAHRLKGVPNGGPATVVVTDVEKYSELMQLNAVVTTQAMGIHNTIIRRAVTTHAGHVIEQEGDSWSVAFHTPVEAVAFCLQVQQALQRSQWPAELASFMSGTSSVEWSSITAAALSKTNSTMAGVMLEQPEQHLDQCSGAPTTTAAEHEESAAALQSPEHITTGGSLLTSKLASLIWHVRSAVQHHTSMLDNASHNMHGSHSGKFGDTSDSGVGGSVIVHCDSRLQPSPNHHPNKSAPSVGTGTSACHESKPTGSRSTTPGFIEGKRNRKSSMTVLGLRVRMGIASGVVSACNDITTSAVVALAKAVSDMANGGQILMEPRTADAVRDLLSDLGCVDHRGYNDKLLSTPHNQAARSNGLARSMVNMLSRVLRVPINERDPILLDMGEYWVPNYSSTLPSATAAVKAAESAMQQSAVCKHDGSATMHSIPEAHEKQLGMHDLKDEWSSQPCTRACICIAAQVVARDQDMDTALRTIRVYSIVAQPLQARSKIWGNHLRLGVNTQLMSKGYFDAPGTLVADLGAMASSVAIERPLLPSVTIVFAAVDDGRRLVRRKEHEAVIIHNVLSKTLQALLLSFTDGYMCREQEAVLKYMVAFKEPTRAAEWCLLVQDMLQYVPWPAQVLVACNSRTLNRSTSTAGAARTAGTGSLKRPGLKMGLAEGVPDSITPDHLGHADYFGTSVNLAARITDAAARSGQVVLSTELGERIFSAWRYEIQMGLHTVPGTTQELGRLVSAAVKGRDDASSCASAATPAAPSMTTVEEDQQLPTPAMLQGPKESIPATKSGVLGTIKEGGDCGQRISWTTSAARLQSRTRLVRTSAHHVGTYMFKGCGAMDLVCLTSDAMLTMAQSQGGAPAVGAKGVLLKAADGPVLGMQNQAVAVPDMLAEFEQAWRTVAPGVRSQDLPTL